MKSIIIACLIAVLALIFVRPDEFVAARAAAKDIAASLLTTSKKLVNEIEQRAAEN